MLGSEVTVLYSCPQRVVDPLVSGLNKAGPLRRAGTKLGLAPFRWLTRYQGNDELRRSFDKHQRLGLSAGCHRADCLRADAYSFGCHVQAPMNSRF